MVEAELQHLLGMVHGLEGPPPSGVSTPPSDVSLIAGNTLPLPPAGGFTDGSDWNAMAQIPASKERAQTNDDFIRQLPKGKGMDTPPALKVPPTDVWTTVVTATDNSCSIEHYLWR